MKLIEAKDIVKTYVMGETPITALDNVSITIEEGEFVAITGSSGSGKSTLMHLLGCLDKPTSGTYFLDNINVSQASRDELAQVRNQKIGFVFQKFYLLTDLTALENVALPLLYARVKEADAYQQAADHLKKVNLGDRLNHYPYQLSGGQQQRVAIARALTNKPRIIFADEPTGNLDSATGNIIMEIFKKLNQEQRVTIVMVTHSPEIAHKTQRVIELADGKIIRDGAPS
ncbi:MAG: ABC transporter ATP-binding protein [Candidatus Babeliales bacterium]|jgi:putative ABC transport system ATP-binding protein